MRELRKYLLFYAETFDPFSYLHITNYPPSPLHALWFEPAIPGSLERKWWTGYSKIATAFMRFKRVYAFSKCTSYKLFYFNHRWRGEGARLIFAQANVPYDDVRVAAEEWINLKPSISSYKWQSVAIITYASTKALNSTWLNQFSGFAIFGIIKKYSIISEKLLESTSEKHLQEQRSVYESSLNCLMKCVCLFYFWWWQVFKMTFTR